MGKRWFDNLSYDPRKILIVGCLISIFIMAFGVMDYRFQSLDYMILSLVILSQIPLLFMGKMKIKLEIEMSDRAGWAFLILSLFLVGYNVYLLGLPYLLIKIQTGMDLTATYGDYYHRNLKLTFLVWSLLTVMIPMSLLVKGKLIKFLLFVWPMIASIFIQIKAPFLFGLFYFLSLYQLTGRKINIVRLALLGFLACLLFVIVNQTRSGITLERAAVIFGVSSQWSALSPLIWYPLSYIGGPLLNCFNNFNYNPFQLNLYPFLQIIPASLWAVESRNFARISNLEFLWSSNNQVAAPCIFSYMFGFCGTIIFIQLVSLLLSVLAFKKFYHSKLLLALFITAINLMMLFPVANYFIDPRFLGDLSIWFICLLFSKVNFTREAGEDGRKTIREKAGPGRESR
jgi:hypothetical protein